MSEVFLGSVYAEIELRDQKFKSSVAEAKSQLSGLESAGNQSTTSLGAAFDNLGSSLTNFASKAAIPAAAIGLIGAAAIKMGGNFEDAMARVAATSGIANNALDKDFKAMSDLALQLGEKTRFSATDAANGLYELASAGMSVQEQMETIPSVLDLANIAQIDVGESANRVSAALKMFSSSGLTASKATDIMAKATQVSLLHFNDLSDGLRMTGASFGTMKQPLDEAATALAVLSDQGYKGAQAGEYLRQVMQYMNPTTDKAITAFTELGIITKDGSNQFFNAAGEMKPFSENIDILRKKLSGLTDEERQFQLQQMFALQGSQAMNSILNVSKSKYEELHDSIKYAEGASASMSATMDSTTKKSFDDLKSSIETTAIKFYTSMQPAMNAALAVIIKFINDLGRFIEEHQKLSAAIGIVAAAFVAIVVVLNIGIAAFGLISASWGVLVALGGVLAAVVGAVGLPFIALAAAIAAVVLVIGTLVIKSGILETQTGNLKRATEAHTTAEQNNKVATDALKDARDNLTNSGLGLERAELALERAQIAYTDAMKKHKPESIEAREAELNLRDAKQRVKEATDAQKKAGEEADKKLLEWIDTEGKAEFAANELMEAQKAPLTSFDNLKNKIGDAIGKLKEWISVSNNSGGGGGGGGGGGRAYASGGWVDQTEMALVHQGEYVLSREMLAGVVSPDPNVTGSLTPNPAPQTTQNVTHAPQITVQVGIYAGSQMEKRAMAKEIFDAYEQYQQGVGAI